MDRFIDSSHALQVALVLMILGHALASHSPQPLAKGLDGSAQSSKVALAYVRPGTDWTRYKTIMLRTLSVPPTAGKVLSKGTPADYGESYLLTDKDVSTLQDYFEKSMRTVLGNAGFTFVSAPQAGTLIVIAQVANIAFNAPAQNAHADSTGMGFPVSRPRASMTISAILADGRNKLVLAEVSDRKYGSNLWGPGNGAANVAEAKAAFDQWARDLRDRLKSNSS